MNKSLLAQASASSRPVIRFKNDRRVAILKELVI